MASASEQLRFLIENERDWEIWDAAKELLAVVEAAERSAALSKHGPYFTYHVPTQEECEHDECVALRALASKLSGEGQLEGQSPTDIAGAGQEGCG